MPDRINAKTEHQIGAMSMKDNNLAVHPIKIRKDGMGAGIGRENGALDSPFTLSDAEIDGEYDAYSD